MRFLAPVGLLVFAVACGDVPDSTLESQQFYLVHATERIEGLQFLPPLVKKSKPQGAFTDAVPASVRIENDAGTVVASFTAADIAVDAGSEHYGVTWDTTSAAPGEYRIVVANPARDIGSIGLELRAGSVGNKAHNAGRSLPIRFRLDGAALDQDGDGTVDWEDRCPDLASEQDGDGDCDGALDDRDDDGVVDDEDRCPDLAYEQDGDEDCDGELDAPANAPASTRITAQGEAYGSSGSSCMGWNDCGDADTCALWACMVNGFPSVASYGHTGPCTEFSTCNLLGGPDAVEMNWGTRCPIMGVTDIDCAN